MPTLMLYSQPVRDTARRTALDVSKLPVQAALLSQRLDFRGWSMR